MCLTEWTLLCIGGLFSLFDFLSILEAFELSLVVVSRVILAGLLSTVTGLPMAEYKKDECASFLSV